MLVSSEPKHAWMQDALCAQADPEKWFPEHSKLTIKPLEICHTCPVLEQCAEYAITTQPDYGVWAGLPAKDIQRYAAPAGHSDSNRVRQLVDRIIEHGTHILEEQRETKKQARQNEIMRHRRYRLRKKQCQN